MMARAAPARIVVAAAAGMAALVAVAVSIALAVTIGEMKVPFGTVLQAIGYGVFGIGGPAGPIQQGVIVDYRLSRAVMAALCGGALALSGAILQALLRNPLAEPYILGISAGASTGAVAVLILGVGGAALSVAGGAFAGSICALVMVALLASGGGGDRVILSGVATAQLFNAGTATIVTTLATAEQARSVMFWLLGDFGRVRWPDIAVAAPVALAGFVVCILHARALDAFAFGSDAAQSLGINERRVRVVLFTVTAIMTCVMVAMVGTIGFVGLVIPHAARFIVGPGHARLLPACLVGGAIFMVGADILSRVLIPQQVLPIGVVTALVGAPAFALILQRARRSA